MTLPPLPHTDFIEYWSAFRLAQNGVNPYDPVSLLALQKTVGLTGSVPTMMWNAPWLLLLMSPVLQLEGTTALVVWRWASVALSILSVSLLLLAFRIKLLSRSGALASFLVLTTLPFWHGIHSGQIHALLLLAIALAIFGRNRGNSWITAAGLALMTLKPHLFGLVALRFIFDAVRCRDITPLVRAALLCSVAAFATELLFPGILAAWINVTVHGAEGPHIPVKAWAVSTLVYPIRVMLITKDGLLPLAPMVLVPGLTAIACLWCWIRNKGGRSQDTLVPYLMVLSYLTSPYGWVSDQLVILPAVLLALERTRALDSFHALLGLLTWVLMQLAGFELRGAIFDSEHHYLWMPVGTALLILLLERGRAQAARRTVANKLY